MDLDLRHTKAKRNLKASSLDGTKNMIEKAKENGKGKTNDYILDLNQTTEDIHKMMTDKNARPVFKPFGN